ncbi:MAG TPA: hypothetical protein VF708_20835 [Pyrinomonadaceae bacterium]
MMNEKKDGSGFNSSFRIPHSSFAFIHRFNPFTFRRLTARSKLLYILDYAERRAWPARSLLQRLRGLPSEVARHN